MVFVEVLICFLLFICLCVDLFRPLFVDLLIALFFDSFIFRLSFLGRSPVIMVTIRCINGIKGRSPVICNA